MFDASVALDTNDYDEFTASWMERISNPLLARQTPGSMTLVRPESVTRISLLLPEAEPVDDVPITK